MAWDRRVRGQIVIRFERTIHADQEDVARREVMERMREEYGPGALITIDVVEPAGDWCGTCLGACTGVHTEEQAREEIDPLDPFEP